VVKPSAHFSQLRQFAKGRDVWLDGRVFRVPGKLGTAIKIKRHRVMDGTPKTSYLVKRADGHWHALIVCEPLAAPDPSHPADDRPAVGIDMGLKVFLADSDGGSVENPCFFRTSQAALRRDVSPTSGSFIAPYQGRLTARKRAGLTRIEYAAV
jgi:hypothetical protein